MNIASSVLSSWCRKGECDALALESEERRVSVNELYAAVADRSAQLGVNQGDHVLVSSRRELLFYVDILAIWACGGVVIPYDPDSGNEYRDMLRKLSDAIIVIDDIYVPNFYSSNKVVFYDRDQDDTAAILFTSGSTGLPKGVELSLSSLLGNSKGLLKKTRMGGDRLLINIPFHFTSAICHFLSAGLSGSTLIAIEKKLIYLDFIRCVSSMRPTFFGGAPIQVRWISEHIEVNGDAALPSLTSVLSSGDHLDSSVIRTLLKHSPSLNIFTVYGLTEVAGRLCVLEPSELNNRIGSVGKPIDGLSIEIFEPDTQVQVRPGEEGEVVVSGEFLAKGYYNNKEASLKSFTGYGFRTGDIGYLDDEGFLYLKGRSDDVFKVNGKKVSGVVISQGLMNTGSFSDAAVIAYDVPVFGTVPMAFVVLAEGKEFKRGDVLKHLRASLPLNHIPHDFRILGTIPRTGSGKVDRVKLRDFLENLS